ncbi:AsmA-like C-terminal region-containing protein [Christiangramia sp. SM2212]|uniref:AsmA-like C-terminal region-containing protein n=1 Tax=Christiangramia sediminicola TaxID=3073267 RepID=A0ABU1EN44_9FLAO|nr:AsmA-like C-terminal region-containing protein [Christiangramia sp. SM2212]MDR5589805.1 AsmA-like C-terminal region-containing protein [Christiangramia sp. SM2212]
MESKNTKNKKPKGKLLKRVGFVVAFILLAPTILFTLGWFNRDTLIDELQDWYKDNGHGQLEIGDVDATFIKGFPNVGFTITDIYQSSFDSILDKRSSISIQKAQVTVGASDLIKGDLKFKNIRINNVEIFSKVISEKTLEEYIRLKIEKQNSPTEGVNLPEWLSDRTDFALRDISFISQDSMLNKSFDLKLLSAEGDFKKIDNKISGNLNFRVQVNKLGFNTKKGSYLRDAMLTGNPEFQLNQINNQLNISEFIMKINDQDFITNVGFDFSGINAYKINLQNPKTDFQEIKKLLADSISSKLSAYEISEPIPINFNLEGEFQYGNTPFIYADFSTSANHGSIHESLKLDNLDFKGYLTNSLNEETIAREQPGKKDIKVYFEEFQAEIEDIKLSANKSYYQSSREADNLLNVDLKMSGSNETLAELLQTNNFDFKGGNFQLDAKIDGNATKSFEVFNSAKGRFTLRNTRVVLQKNKLQLPVEILDIKLEDRNSILENLKINLADNEQLVFRGQLRNISSLLEDDPVLPASADVMVASQELNINNLIDTAMELIPTNQKPKNELKTLHQTFEAVYNKFQPRIKLDLKKVEYDANEFRNLNADVELTDAETVSFRKLSFDYQESSTELSGILKIPEPASELYEPIFLNIDTRSSGAIGVFQELFNIQLVKITNGDYVFSGNVTGNIQELDQLLDNTSGDLKLLNAKFYYPEGDLEIELDSLKVAVLNSNIELKKFLVEIDDHNPFYISGRVEDFPGFLLDSSQANGKISMGLEADFVDINKWMGTIDSMDLDSANKSVQKRDLDAIFADINYFDPELTIQVDSLKYKEILSENIAAKIYFENDSILKLNDLKIKFKESSAVIKGELQARNLRNSTKNKNPFNFKFSAEGSGNSQDLNDLLQTVNFDLKSGNFKVTGSYEGKAQDLKILSSDIKSDLTLGETVVDIEGTDIEIPIDSLHLYIENNLATLERLDVNLPGKSSIDITGKIDSFSNFINNDQAIDSHNSSFKVRSPYLDSKDIKEFIGAGKKDKTQTDSKNFRIRDLKNVISNLNYTYFPSAEIAIDTLIYDNVAVSNFATEIGFDDSGDIMVENSQLKYRDGQANFNLKGGLGVANQLPVMIDMKIQNIDLEELVVDLDYFNDSALRNTEKLGGTLDLDFDVTGSFDEDGKLKMNSLNGDVKVDLRELVIHEYQPLLENVKVLKEERFKKLEFQPITQTFQVVDGEIIIPRTQIQSTAVQVFVEGEMKPGEYYNIWISVPWNNIFKSRDGIELPKKISYDKSGAKFYLQIIQDKESEKPRKQELRTKFRLGNRKLEKSKRD